MPRVNSTAIERVRALPLPGGFRVHFHSGDVYEVDAPRDVYLKLRRARSVGTFYNSNVRGKYPTRKVNG